MKASETQQLADATPICYMCGVVREQPSTNDGRDDLQHTIATHRLRDRDLMKTRQWRIAEFAPDTPFTKDSPSFGARRRLRQDATNTT